MTRILRDFLLCILLTAAVYPGDADSGKIPKYFGLAIPYPENDPVLVLPDTVTTEFGRRRYEINLTVDSTGTINELQWVSDSAFPLTVLADDMKNIRFQFLPGRDIPAPHIVPISMIKPGRRVRGDTLSLTFPVSPEITTDSVLLREYFELNDIDPPRVTNLPPVNYIFDVYDTTARCWTVTMLVSVDETGQLHDIVYPNPVQKSMAHHVHVAVMHASFEPARLGGKPFAAEFLLTFRVFSNIDYPFSPFQTKDTTVPPLITTRYFMTHYYNENDISIFPLPHNHARGFIRGTKFADYPPGSAHVLIGIDETGKISRLVVQRCREELLQPAYDAAWQMSWYPATDPSGKPIEFTGRMLLEFTGSTRVVYIPEWLPR